LVNGGDSPAGKTFTIFHELAHLINRTSGLCALHDFIDEEAVANNFAANFLMPEAAVRRIVKQKSEPLEAVEQLAKYFKVSTLAAAVRLRRLHLIGDENLNQVKVISEEKWDRAREASKQKEGFVPPWRLRYRDLGATYIGTVARAIEDQRVDLVDATYLLNARLPLVEQILEEYYRTGGTQ
jgi:Zn-dependent peptidase ImmA (M78 family)